MHYHLKTLSRKKVRVNCYNRPASSIKKSLLVIEVTIDFSLLGFYHDHDFIMILSIKFIMVKSKRFALGYVSNMMAQWS